jgi:Tfp pilus assembly protein PilF
VPPGDLGSLTRRKPAPVKKVQTKDERVDEDLRVAKFYMNDEDLPGAYLRAKDAVRTEPDYSETHFMLGQVAQKMKKNEEAIAEYEAYLKMDPGGERTKEVTSALEKLKK